MSHTSSSAMLVAACILAISCITVNADFSCKIPRNFKVKVADQSTAIISKAELNVEMKLLTYNVHSGINSVEILANSVILNFTGYLELEIGNRNVGSQPTKFSKLYYNKLSGKKTPKSEDPTTDNCQIVLQPIGPVTSRTYPSIASEVLRFAKSCLQREICSKIDPLGYQNDEDSSSKGGSNFSSANNSSTIGTLDNDTTIAQCDNEAMQKTVNSFVDIGINQLVAKLGSHDGGAIDLPNVDKNIPYGPHLQLFNGTFRDMRTLHRRSDALISHNGDLFIAAVEIGLDKLDVTYNNYKIKFGMRASGHLSGTSSNVALAARVSADFTEKPCIMKLEKLKVTEFGDIRFNVTGLGKPLNWMLSTITDTASKILKKNIVYTIQQNVRQLIQTQLSKFDCDQLRPSITRS